jgi:hypothetical protein
MGIEANWKDGHHSAAIWSFILTMNCFFTVNYVLILFSTFKAEVKRKQQATKIIFFSDVNKAEERKIMKSKSLGKQIFISILLFFFFLICLSFLLLSVKTILFLLFFSLFFISSLELHINQQILHLISILIQEK